MGWNWNRVSDLFTLNQKDRVFACNIPSFNQIRSFNLHLKIEYFHLFSQLALLLCHRHFILCLVFDHPRVLCTKHILHVIFFFRLLLFNLHGFQIDLVLLHLLNLLVKSLKDLLELLHIWLGFRCQGWQKFMLSLCCIFNLKDFIRLSFISWRVYSINKFCFNNIIVVSLQKIDIC